VKTLVIHPSDATTDFLKEIYLNKSWTVINNNPSKKFLKEMIKTHDRIIMLGHGCKDGLFGFDRLVIDSNLVYLLREKNCVCIWCNADEFVEKYNLRGFYTGMIISDVEEALMYFIKTDLNQIKESNEMFANAIKIGLDYSFMVDKVKSLYNSKENSVIFFNRGNLFFK